jgi:hypothetical protein
MKKLVGFGDSFIAINKIYHKWIHSDDMSWLKSTGDLLNLPVVNYGVSGSSLNYSFIKFIDYIQSDSYDENDVIVFVISEDNRIFSKGMDPKDSCQISNNRFNSEYIAKNADHLLWMLENYLCHEMNFEAIKTLCVLQSWALLHPTNTVVIKTGFSIDLCRSGELKNLIVPSFNFLPIIDYPLNRVQHCEFSDSTYAFQTHEHIDPRVNHMSPINRKVMSKIMGDVIVNKSIDYYDNSKFHTGFIDSNIGGKNYWI